MAEVLDHADADAHAELRRRDELAQHADAERRLGRVGEGAVHARRSGQRERLRDRRGEQLVDLLEGGLETSAGAGGVLDHVREDDGDDPALAALVDGHGASYAALPGFSCRAAGGPASSTAAVNLTAGGGVRGAR